MKKEKKTKLFSVRLKNSDREKLREMAENLEVSQSNLIMQMYKYFLGKKMPGK